MNVLVGLSAGGRGLEDCSGSKGCAGLEDRVRVLGGMLGVYDEGNWDGYSCIQYSVFNMIKEELLARRVKREMRRDSR